MKVCCSSRSHSRAFASGGITQLEWIDACANELALDGVELDAAHFPRTDGDYLAQLKKLCVDRWLVIAAVSVEAPPLGLDDAAVEEFARWVDAANALGAPLVRFASPAAPADQPQAWPTFIHLLKGIAEHAKSANVTLAMQPRDASLVASALDARRVMKECDSAWLRLAITAAHLGGSDTDLWTDLMPDSSIVVAPVRRLDVFGADEIVDYRRALDALARQRYRGFISLEYQGDEPEMPAVARAAAWLRGMVAKDELKETE